MFQPPNKRFKGQDIINNPPLAKLDDNINTSLTQEFFDSPKSIYQSENCKSNRSPIGTASPAFTYYSFFSTRSKTEKSQTQRNIENTHQPSQSSYLKLEQKYSNPHIKEFRQGKDKNEKLSNKDLQQLYIPIKKPPSPPQAQSPVLANIEKYAFQPEPIEEKQYAPKSVIMVGQRSVLRKKSIKRLLKKDSQETVVNKLSQESNDEASKNPMHTIKHFFKKVSPKKNDSHNNLNSVKKKNEELNIDKQSNFESKVDESTFHKYDTESKLLPPPVPDKPTVKKNGLDLTKEKYPSDHFLGIDDEMNTNEELRGALMFITRFQDPGKRKIRYSLFDETTLCEDASNGFSNLQIN